MLTNSVFLSLKIALSNKFKKILQDQNFQQHLILVTIDEVHVVSEWDQHWRDSYSHLMLLRDLIDRSVPWLSCFATLDSMMLIEIQELCEFDSITRIQRTSIDRSNIRLAIQCTQHFVDTFNDLDFLIESIKTAVERTTEENSDNMIRETLRHDALATAQAIVSTHTRQETKQARFDSRACCRTISKTVVYIDFIKLIETTVHVLIKKLIQANSSKTSVFNVIKVYYSELAEFDKRSIFAEFAKSDVEDVLKSLRHRIIVAIDAMKMSINNSDIRRVVQWKQSSSMCALWQRVDRAARDQAICDEFVWFVESWCFEDRLDASTQVKKRTTERKRRFVLSRDLWKLINLSTCIRRSILEFYDDDLFSQSHLKTDSRLCCSRCVDIEIRSRISKAEQSVRIIQSQKHITAAMNSTLIEWRETKTATILFLMIFSTIFMNHKMQLILSNKTIFDISRTDAIVDSIDALITAINERWADLRLYEDEIVEVIQNACLQATLVKTRSRRFLTAIDVNSAEIRDESNSKRMRLMKKTWE